MPPTVSRVAEITPPCRARQIAAAPYKRQTVWLPVTTTGAGTIQFNATAGDKIDHDGIRHTFEVRRRYSLEAGTAELKPQKSPVH